MLVIRLTENCGRVWGNGTMSDWAVNDGVVGFGRTLYAAASHMYIMYFELSYITITSQCQQPPASQPASQPDSRVYNSKAVKVGRSVGRSAGYIEPLCTSFLLSPHTSQPAARQPARFWCCCRRLSPLISLFPLPTSSSLRTFYRRRPTEYLRHAISSTNHPLAHIHSHTA